jgi:hypothetical protein
MENGLMQVLLLEPLRKPLFFFGRRLEAEAEGQKRNADS